MKSGSVPFPRKKMVNSYTAGKLFAQLLQNLVNESISIVKVLLSKAKNLFRPSGESDDKAVNSSGRRWWVSWLAPLGAIFAAFGGGLLPNFLADQWHAGAGDLKLLGAIMLILIGAGLPTVASRLLESRRNPSLRLEQAVEGFKEAAVLLAKFDPKTAGVGEVTQLQKDLADRLARAITVNARGARVVVYLAERRDNQPGDAEGTVDSMHTKSRFFSVQCFGGRPDEPTHDKYVPEEGQEGPGSFFCRRVLMKQQTIIQNIKRPPRDAMVAETRSNKYGSFILTPVVGADKSVRGAISVDYPGKSRFDSFDCAVAWHIARLFRDALDATVKSAYVTADELSAATSKLVDEDKEGKS